MESPPLGDGGTAGVESEKRQRQEEPSEPQSEADVSWAARSGIPVTIITGWLGSGKTTILNRMLQSGLGNRAVVFVNEFGAVGIDGPLLLHGGGVDEQRVVELNDGCICCEINEDFSSSLRLVLERKQKSGLTVEHIVVETSGAAEPAPLLTTITRIDDLDFTMHIEAVVTVVDATRVDDAVFRASEVAQAQLGSADIVLVTHTDLLDPAAAEQAAADVSAKIPGRCPPIHHAVKGEVPLAFLIGRRVHQPALPAKRACHGQVTSFVWSSNKKLDSLKFEEWVESADFAALGVVRAKGLLWMTVVPLPVIFHLVGVRTNPFEVLETAKPTGSELVWIGTKQMNEQEIRDKLDSMCC
mmetsp:Transcript_94272/g.215650  ORF Transcript_94272/g.215650 Transcript_94272/m.215650 type:complete len:356 (+) Transcript_94272:2-1069(+)